jgi:hypothetical protein
MGALSSVYVNDYDLGSLGATVELVDGLRAAAGQRWVSTPVVGRAGELLLSGRPSVQPRRLILRGKVTAASQAALESAVDALKSRLNQGAIEVRTAANLNRVLLCRLTGFAEQPFTPQMLTPLVGFTADLEALSPAWADREPIIVSGAAAARVPCPVGNLPVAPVVQILGASGANPVLTLRAANGDSRGSMTFTVTLAATEYLEIDMDAKTATKVASGTPTNGLSLLTAGDFLALTPEDGDEIAGTYPTLEVSSGTLQISYHRRWA